MSPWKFGSLVRHMKTKTIIPNILGVGLICLDIIKVKDEVRYINGGSCGNVATALSFLGWNSYVISRSYSDIAGNIINENLTNTGVKKIDFGKKPVEAPRIIEELLNEKGEYCYHKFLMKCDVCKKKMPLIKLINKNDARGILNAHSNFNVLYSDRSSDGVDHLKKIFNERGDWVVYEPNSSRNFNSFIIKSKSSHIVKFSSDRIPLRTAEKLKELAIDSHILLIVYTMGKDGLLFCYRKRNNAISKWIHLKSQPVPKLVDPSGAGDWCTAGLLNVLIGNNIKRKNWLSKNEVIAALQYGQALSAISCAFIGGQGLIYANFNDETIKETVKKLKNKTKREVRPAHITFQEAKNLCPLCLRQIA